MTDSTSAELLQEIRHKAQLSRIWPLMIVTAIAVLGLMIYNAAPAWTYWISIPASIGAVVWAVVMDKIRKTVVLFYDLEPHIEEAYQRLHNSFVFLRECSCVWHVTSSGRITTAYEKKRNAGANAVIRRNRILPGAASQPYFKCNVAIPALNAGRQTLYFLPDRVLVWDSQDVGAVTYDQLQVNVTEETFIEEECIPADGRVVGSTWKYVNQKGGPDRRFKDNRELPLLRYEAIFLVSPSGLQELFQASRLGIGYQVNYAVSQMASAIARRNLPKPKESFIKCTCNSCAGSIEFPSTGIGQFIDCPHCGLQTRLFQPVY